MVTLGRLTGYLAQRLDLVGAILGSLAGAAVAGAGYLSGALATAEMGVAVLAGSILYLFLRKRLVNSGIPSLPSSKSLTLVLNIIFVVALAASLYLMQSSLYRPFLYFWLISIAVAAVATEILLPENRSQTWLVLVKILLISLSLRAGLYYEFPGFTGSDAWSHEAMIETWIDNKQITSAVPTLASGFTGYADFPAMHLGVMAMRLITSVSPKDSLFLSVGIFNLVSILFIFLIGQRLLGREGGLLAALFIGISQPHIAWGATLIPMSLGLGIFTALVFLVFKRTASVTSASLFVLLSLVSVITHTISAFIILITLGLILIASEVYKRLDRERVEWLNVGYNAVILFGVLMLGRWMYSFFYPSQSFFDAVAGWFFQALRVDVEFVGTVVYRASESTLNRLWFLWFIGFTIIGSLAWLNPKKRSNLRMAIIMGTAGLAIITFLFPLFNIENLIPGRWVPFVSVIGAALVIQGIIALATTVRGQKRKAIVLVSLIFAFSLLSVNSSGVNTQTPFYNEPARIGFVQSELSAAETIARNYDGGITTDWDYAELYFRTQIGVTDLTYLDPAIKEKGVIVIREYIRERPQLMEYHWRPGAATLEETVALFRKFDGGQYDLVYNGGEVQAYVKSW